jgi:uncharacterized membrane protein YhaH (DUF805 family)
MQAGAPDTIRSTRRLLACGIASGVVFFAVAIAQVLTREGFDIRRNAISMLSLGDEGWIQVTSFLVTGVLAILCAAGVRRAIAGQRGGTWGALLIGTFGLGLVIAGIFRPDPGFGYPPGSPPGPATAMSGHAAGHALGFFLCLVSTIAGVIVFARRFKALGETGWVAYLVATALLGPILIAASAVFMNWGGVIVALAGAVMFGWVAAVAGRLRSEIARTP